MDPIIRLFLRNPEKLYRMLNRYQSNEEFLYRIVECGIGFGKITEVPYRPLHGFHLGWLRGSQDSTGYFAPDSSNRQRVEYDNLKKGLNEYFHDPLFRRMLSILPNPEIIKLSRLVSMADSLELNFSSKGGKAGYISGFGDKQHPGDTP